MDTFEQLNGKYYFDGMSNLSKNELIFWIIYDEGVKQLGIKDLFSFALIVGGLPMIDVSGKIDAAKTTAGTSYLSVASRRLIKHRVKKPLKTITWEKMLKGKWAYTVSLGGYIGRWLPVFGVIITAYDLAQISRHALERYNLIVGPRDKIS